ncbi:Caffeic acid 3-O-methyltransferase [Bienertia sinuspersici]
MATTLETNTNNNRDLEFLNINNDNVSDTITDHNNEEETYYSYTYQLVNSIALPMVMKVTINMGVLQLIHDHASPSGLSPAEIATHINSPNLTAPDMLDRMLRLLATHSVVQCTTISTVDGGLERRYSPSPVTKFLVPNDDGVSLAGILNLLLDKVYIESWTKLGEAIEIGGIPFDMVHGMNAFEYPSVDPRFNEVFNNAMCQTTTFIIKKILEKYKGFENIQKLVDVGGGVGHALRIITSKYPSINGINFDLPHVIQTAIPCTGIEHVSGDMFESVPKGDAIFMKWILHDWSDEHCLKLLKNCYNALPENGKVIVVDAIMANKVESTNYNKALTQMDVLMMTQNPGGKERSKKQFEALAKRAGFSNFKIDCWVYNLWIMEFYK